MNELVLTMSASNRMRRYWWRRQESRTVTHGNQDDYWWPNTIYTPEIWHRMCAIKPRIRKVVLGSVSDTYMPVVSRIRDMMIRDGMSRQQVYDTMVDFKADGVIYAVFHVQRRKVYVACLDTSLIAFVIIFGVQSLGIMGLSRIITIPPCMIQW